MAEGMKVQTHFSSSDRQVPAATAINTGGFIYKMFSA